MWGWFGLQDAELAWQMWMLKKKSGDGFQPNSAQISLFLPTADDFKVCHWHWANSLLFFLVKRRILEKAQIDACWFLNGQTLLAESRVTIAGSVRRTKTKGRKNVKGTPEFEMCIIAPWIYPVSEFLPNIYIFFFSLIFLQCFGFLVSTCH